MFRRVLFCAFAGALVVAKEKTASKKAAPTQAQRESAQSQESSSSVLPTLLAGVVTLGLLAGGAFYFVTANAGPKKKPRSAILILGQCNAGKTSLFFLLRNAIEKLPLVSSLKILRDRVSVAAEDGGESSGSIDVIECPGHQRMRNLGFEALTEAKAILYLVDGTDKSSIKDASEHL